MLFTLILKGCNRVIKFLVLHLNEARLRGMLGINLYWGKKKLACTLNGHFIRYSKLI